MHNHLTQDISNAMTDESRKLFEKLVKRGQAIEKDTKDLISEANKRISSQTLDLETITTQLNQGLNDIRKTFSDRLGLPEPVTRADLDRLETKVDALAAKIAKLEATPAKRSTRKTTSARPKAAASKPAARRTAATKSPTAKAAAAKKTTTKSTAK